MGHACNLYTKSLWSCPCSKQIVYYYRRNFAPGYSLVAHCHGQAEIMYVEAGEVTLELGERPVSLRASEFVVINGGVPHGKLPVERECRILNCEFFFRYDPTGVVTTLAVARRLGNNRWPFVHGRPWVKGRDTGGVGRNLIDLIEIMDRGRDPLLSDLAFWRVFAELAATIGQPLPNTDAPNLHVRRAIEFMRSRYSWDLTVSDISDHLQRTAAISAGSSRKSPTRRPMNT